ncbi:response regulator transcription factor [Nitrogeniibacter mangrovi]|uniref:Response regulator transcription factor n=1 Tax=Nitrogeniibacter mangrovi TaxID=2016596 RepID=A0A6C1B6J7_9RHOO|nr:response regulator transcription factor [Nitrogeniibacter mangrovi]QID18338.1 response regulator transcription factor [Nitrogeniibacter mangrovi]
MRLLLVEDDAMIAAGIGEVVEREGWRIDLLEAAEPAIGAMALTAYDAAIIDVGLPGMDGFELVRRLRAQGALAPILMLTARDGLDDRVTGLDCGADDYLIKPFLAPELLARLRALIRRSHAGTRSMMVVGALCLDAAAHTVTVSGQPVALTGRELSVLEQLMLAAPKVAGKARLMESLGQWDREITPNAIEIYISRLRTKLGGAVLIRTVRGIGYRIEAGEG